MDRSTPTHSRSRVRRALRVGTAIVTAPLWLAWVALYLIAQVIWVVALYALAWTYWIGWARRRVLFVYSDSPHWKTYVEENILPSLPANAVIMNWSQRKSWETLSVAAMLFHGFAGEREFNPVGLVFQRFRVVQRYRFWQAFRDARHGHPDALETLRARFLADVAGRTR